MQMHGFPLLKDIGKIYKSRRFHIFMIVKVHGLSSMGDSMVIKTDKIKAEMVNYNKTKYMTITLSETLILNQVDKIILPRSNNYILL